MPTNHTTQPLTTQRSALSARLTELALEANEIADLLFAQEMDGWAAEIYAGGPARLLQLVLDELQWQVERSWLPLDERRAQLELSRMVAGAIPPERRAKYLADKDRASRAEASIAGRSQR